jgi:triacylglycerol esterase/lipase EstA (alpha/beta hydrolase family)
MTKTMRHLGRICRSSARPAILGRTATVTLLALTCLISACSSSPVTVTRVDARDVHRRLTQSALSTGQLSPFSRNILLEADLSALYDDDPEKALEHLHDLAVSGSGGPNELFAAAEASFLHAERTRQLPYYLVATLYAWAYLFADDPVEVPSPFDPRFRLAADIYNRGLTSALETAEGRNLALRGGAFDLPFGRQLHVAFDPEQLHWRGRRMTGFAPVAELRVSGLQGYYGDRGIGAPLAAKLTPLADEARPKDLLAPELTIPVTVVLRLPHSRSRLAWDPLEGVLEVRGPEANQRVEIEGQSVPLESEFTAVLAYSLADSPIWSQEYQRFFQPLKFGRDDDALLYASLPHRRGRIPVVFVHGTASSFGRWAEMYNRLAADRRLRDRYEFWFFSYNSGAAVSWSSMLLREALRRAVQLLDPSGTDPGMQSMVVIGHSQGGLLTKMTVIDSGSRFWNQSYKKPLEALDVSPETRDVLRRWAFVKPLPFVKRVVFLATPHHGSPLTVGRIAAWVGGYVATPFEMAAVVGDLTMRNKDAFTLSSASSVSKLPTSMDQMNPRNPFLTTLAEIPITPGVTANSIIAVQGTGPIEDGSDGVVPYRSAHIDGVESEVVIRSTHSVQDQPGAVEEVRRILLLHATGVPEPPR